MTPHDSTHERALEELLMRDDAAAGDALALRAAECARCALEIDEFRRTMASLDAALVADFTSIDRAQEDILSAARSAPLGSRADVIEAGIRVGALPPEARRPRRGFLVPAVALSAAAIGLFSFWLARSHSSPALPSAHDTGTMLSANTGVECTAPEGAVAAFDTFTWSDTASIPNGESYTLIIRSLDRTESDGRPVEIRITDLPRPSHTISAQQGAALGRSIRWEVRICDAAGTATSRFGAATSNLTPR